MRVVDTKQRLICVLARSLARLLVQVPWPAAAAAGVAVDQAAAGQQLESCPCRGKLQYISPETFLELPHDPWAADVWSVGVVLFTCLMGCGLYSSPRDSAFAALVAPGGLARCIEQRRRQGYGKPLSAGALELLSSLLRPQPRERPSLEQLLQHPWLQQQQQRGAAEGVAAVGRAEGHK